MKISIIIPVYNAEKYLKRCVESVIKSLGKVKGEVLLINNNSSDNSLKITKSLASSYKNTVRVLRCNKPGASSSRNLGAKKAKGEFIWFVDADDRIAPDAIKELLAKSKTADLVMMGAQRISRNNTSYLSAINPTEKDYKSCFVRYGMGPWQVLIRRKWWLSHNFQFKEGIIHEDMELMSALILYTNSFVSVDKPLYYYYENPDSVLHQSAFNSHIFDIFPALEGLYLRFEEADATEEYHAELEWFFIWNLLIDSAKDFDKFKEGKPGFKRSREMLKQYFPHWRKNSFLQQKPLKLRIRVRINYYK